MSATGEDPDGAGPDGAGPARKAVLERRFEIIATILLSVAALATAWSGFQASLWDGIQSSDYSQASSARVRATQKEAEGNQIRLADLSVFESYLKADADGDTELAEFYRRRFSPEFTDAYEAWVRLDPDDPDTPRSPLGMGEYSTAADQEAADLHALADERFASGEEANDNSDAFTLTTLLFAMVLFFAAISERFEHAPSRSVLLGLATLALIAGTVLSITQPVTTG